MEIETDPQETDAIDPQEMPHTGTQETWTEEETGGRDTLHLVKEAEQEREGLDILVLWMEEEMKTEGLEILEEPVTREIKIR